MRIGDRVYFRFDSRDESGYVISFDSETVCVKRVWPTTVTELDHGQSIMFVSAFELYSDENHANTSMDYLENTILPPKEN